MANSWIKKAGIVALAFVAYRGYQLYELGNSFSYRFKGMFFRRPKTGSDYMNNLIVEIDYVISNPTKSSLKMRGLYGTISVKGEQVAAYEAGPFTIKPGENPLRVSMSVKPYFAATVLLPGIRNNEFPIFDATLTSVFPFGIKYTEKFKINTREYVPSTVQALFA